jgi:DNA-binding SARP family transcriptional activator
MFGTLEISVGAARLGPGAFGGVKPKQLLEVLLLERGRLVTKERVGELLWGERLPQRLAATVESYVSVLRRALRPASPIATEAGGYRLPSACSSTSIASRRCCARRRLPSARSGVPRLRRR